jgi:hypothetical protein
MVNEVLGMAYRIAVALPNASNPIRRAASKRRNGALPTGSAVHKNSQDYRHGEFAVCGLRDFFSGKCHEIDLERKEHW